MKDDPVDIELLGWLPLKKAIQQAAAAWDCDPGAAWDHLQRWMRGGTIRSKTKVENVTPDGSRFSHEQIPPDTWADPQDNRDGKHGPWSSIRTPIFVNEDDLKKLLQRVGSGSQQEVEGADQAILLHFYDRISEPSSRVPIGPLTDALREDRGAFHAAFMQAIQAGLFDDEGLEFLCQGQWSPLNSTNVQIAIEVAGNLATFERRYVMTAALPLNSLMAWATKFDVPLPDRLRRDWSADHIAAGPPEEAVPQPSVPTPMAAEETPKSKGGRPAHPDKTRMLEHAAKLIESGQYASREDRSQTKKKLVEAVCLWMKENAFGEYDEEYVGKLLTPMWRGTR